jgi:4a-hydroxytetrahydrobiopterin dehydratase
MSDIAQDLLRKKCAPCEGGVAPLTDAAALPNEARQLLERYRSWRHEAL